MLCLYDKIANCVDDNGQGPSLLITLVGFNQQNDGNYCERNEGHHRNRDKTELQLENAGARSAVADRGARREFINIQIIQRADLQKIMVSGNYLADDGHN